jgi:hypothetical protein
MQIPLMVFAKDPDPIQIDGIYYIQKIALM